MIFPKKCFGCPPFLGYICWSMVVGAFLLLSAPLPYYLSGVPASSVLWTHRRKELEHLVTAGKIDGKRSRDRQKEKILDRMTAWLQKDKVIVVLIYCSQYHLLHRQIFLHLLKKGIYIKAVCNTTKIFIKALSNFCII